MLSLFLFEGGGGGGVTGIISCLQVNGLLSGVRGGRGLIRILQKLLSNVS